MHTNIPRIVRQKKKKKSKKLTEGANCCHESIK